MWSVFRSLSTHIALWRASNLVRATIQVAIEAGQGLQNINLSLNLCNKILKF